MNRATIDRLAEAVLYEGYVLYPYRPSVKNRQRWTVGGLYPKAYCQAAAGTEIASGRTEVLLQGGPDAEIEIHARFLHLTDRQVSQIEPTLERWPADRQIAVRPVDSLRVGERVLFSWQEAEAREIALSSIPVSDLVSLPVEHSFSFPARRWQEPVAALDGRIAAVLDRVQQAIEGGILVAAKAARDGLYRISATLTNRTEPSGGIADLSRGSKTLGRYSNSRDEALMQTLVSAHLVLGVRGGRFLSPFDPPEDCREAADACRNEGLWPVLAGEPGRGEAILAAPIILYDYPEVAPESPGDLFDSTEIDEILTLRILTLTDEEKLQVAAVDDRARALLKRTETLADADLAGLHGALRPVRPQARGGDG